MEEVHSVILGKGPIGRTLASTLANRGERVTVASRSGAPATVAPIQHVAVDVTDASALAHLSCGASAIYCCVNPPYHQWPAQWPPIVDALIRAGQESGAVVVMAGNLYAYGAAHPHMTETTPLDSAETKGRVRATVWQRLQKAHDQGRIRAVEVRGSDYVGPGAGPGAHGGDRLLKPLLAGKTVRPVGSVNQPHSWTYLEDFAGALVAAAVTENAWGQPWHVPSPEPLTIRQLAEKFAAAAGLPEPRLAPISPTLLRAAGVFVPMLREIAAVSYQFTAPFVMESTESQSVLRVSPTPWNEIVAATLASYSRPASRPGPAT